MSAPEREPPQRSGFRSSFPMQFRAWVSSRREETGPLGLTLIGATVEQPGEVVQLSFAGAAPRDLPEALEEPRLEQLDERRFRLTTGSRSWDIEGLAHIHRAVGRAFYEVLPARRAPWKKRTFWRVILALAGNRLTQRVLLPPQE